jgi:eukaryotic-like serine/threonine-protein kinase
MSPIGEVMWRLYPWVAPRSTSDMVDATKSGLRFTELLFGVDSPASARARLHLGHYLLKDDRAEEAIGLFDETLRLYRSRLGPDHRETVIAEDGLAISLYRAGRYEQELPLLEHIIAKADRTEPTRDWRNIHRLGVTLARLERYDEALPKLEESLFGLRSSLGPNDPWTLGTMKWIAYILTRRGDLTRAIELRQSVLDGYASSLGPGHPDSITAMYVLATYLHIAGRDSEARALAGSVLDWKRRVGIEQDEEAGKVRDFLALIDGRLDRSDC